MQFRFSISATVLSALAIQSVQGCDDCYGPTNFVTHERIVRRMQPSAENATTGPASQLNWGQLNVIHTTDTHGWLEGHLKEQNYGADWGDFVSFTRHMKQKAADLKVDLLLIDTGDLHDGNGLSDVTNPNGAVSNPIFESVEYDLLTIGNHELYTSEIAYETFNDFAKYYGEKYLTSNVKIKNPATGEFEYIGQQYRYFTTPMGLRIMSFGVIFDFNGNSKVANITLAKDMVREEWFKSAVQYTKPIDLFVVLGHNPVRASNSLSTMGTIVGAIRNLTKDVPIQVFGGHTHVRDFTVYDLAATGLESGRYCETLGWFSMTGINSSTYFGSAVPSGVPIPIKAAVNYTAGEEPPKTPQYRYSRRYLDWNRRTFAYHAAGSQSSTFDLAKGLEVTEDIKYERLALNLSNLYGCAPKTYCISCAKFGSPDNVYSVFELALATVVVNETRKNVPRLIFANTMGVRFDLVEGPFTLDDAFIVSPFTNTFQYIPDVPYAIASQILACLNDPHLKCSKVQNTSHLAKREEEEETQMYHSTFTGAGTCEDPVFGNISAMPEAPESHTPTTRGIIRRQITTEVPGYNTTDDFGNDGDDTPHISIPYFDQPKDFQANASFPGNTKPDKVDVVFFDHLNTTVMSVLNNLGGNYTLANILPYLDPSFTSNMVLPQYAKIAWQENMPNCPVGQGVGFPN